MKKSRQISDIRFDMLPLDVQRYIKIRIVFRIVAFILLEALAVLSIYAVNSSYYDFEPISLAVILIIIALSPFVISGFPYKLIDKSWRGKIIAVDVETGVDSCMVGGKPHIYIKNTIVLTILKENGKLCTKEVLALGSRSNLFADMWNSYDTKHGMDHYAVGDVNHDIENYRVGDEVYHFYGLDDLVVRREDGRSIVECVVCSTTNPVHRADCFCCGHTLAKFSVDNKDTLDEAQ